MLVLRAAAASPFVRKVRIAAAVLGLEDRIEISAADTNNPDDSLRTQNPLGKIPALILEDGEAIFDSAVIVEYLDWLAGGGKIIPGEPQARFRSLTQQCAGRRNCRRRGADALRDSVARAGAALARNGSPTRARRSPAPFASSRQAAAGGVDRRRDDRARLRARLSRSALRGRLARGPSAARRLARRLLRRDAEFRGDPLPRLTHAKSTPAATGDAVADRARASLGACVSLAPRGHRFASASARSSSTKTRIFSE